MKLRFLILFFAANLLISCTETPVKPSLPFDLVGRDYLYTNTKWSFSGRIAVADKKKSFSASISWLHLIDRDEIELSGPLGQGRTQIIMSKQNVLINYGDEKVEYFGDIDDVLSRQMGISVPVSALKFWVMGLVKPEIEHVDIENGFLQAGWSVEFQKMQWVGTDELPKKIRVKNADAKLKLIIDDWQI